MKTSTRGFAPIVIILIGAAILALGVGGYWWSKHNRSNTPVVNQKNTQVASTTDETVALSINDILNGAYQPASLDATGSVQFIDGGYEWKELQSSVIEKDKIAFGDLDGDGLDDAAFITINNLRGGSAQDIDLVVAKNVDGKPQLLDSITIKDGLQGQAAVANSISIQNSQIKLDLILHGLNDGVCCTTQHVQRTYELQNGKLIKINEVDINDTSTWKTYRNEKNGFEFEYPTDWQIVMMPSTDYPHPESGKNVLYVKAVSSSQTLQQYLEAQNMPIPKLGSPPPANWSKNILVAGLSAIERENISINAGFLFWSTYFKNNGVIFAVSISGRDKKYTQADIILYEQIVSTFKFTK